MRDLFSELEKLYLCYGKANVGMEEVKKLAIYSRNYNIFELMDNVSLKKCQASLFVLKRYMEEEGRDATQGIIGMFVRQIRLLWQAKSVMKRGGRTAEVSKALGVRNFVAKKLEQQTQQWCTEDLEKAFDLIYQADCLLKAGSPGHLVLENLVLSLCK